MYSPVQFTGASFVPFAAIFWNLSGGACLWERLCKAFYIRAVVKIASREGEISASCGIGFVIHQCSTPKAMKGQ
ncbi:hypothetical protein BGAL_0179g00050 [Botrytis galanthina]|uniref:Uncharacterized protein n=1 Tax=Botrytis galanthina TaxID=278940 RepID=A0A4S8QXQ9_9HELO|nr:hypothetical protein BGAL_0179g00050 [Botrytis galanthina]